METSGPFSSTPHIHQWEHLRTEKTLALSGVISLLTPPALRCQHSAARAWPPVEQDCHVWITGNCDCFQFKYKDYCNIELKWFWGFFPRLPPDLGSPQNKTKLVFVILALLH